MGHGQAGLELYGTPKKVSGLGGAAALQQDISKIDLIAGMAAVTLDGAAYQLQRDLPPAHLMGADAQTVQRVGVMRIEPQDLLIERRRLRQPSGLMQARGLMQQSLDLGRLGRRKPASPLVSRVLSRAALLAIHVTKTVKS